MSSRLVHIRTDIILGTLAAGVQTVALMEGNRNELVSRLSAESAQREMQSVLISISGFFSRRRPNTCGLPSTAPARGTSATASTRYMGGQREGATGTCFHGIIPRTPLHSFVHRSSPTWNDIGGSGGNAGLPCFDGQAVRN